MERYTPYYPPLRPAPNGGLGNSTAVLHALINKHGLRIVLDALAAALAQQADKAKLGGYLNQEAVLTSIATIVTKLDTGGL